jgi:hypothetical protein
VLLGNVYSNMFLWKFFYPLNYLIIFIEKKIFNIVYNEIIMQRFQNMKFHKGKFSALT